MQGLFKGIIINIMIMQPKLSLFKNKRKNGKAIPAVIVLLPGSFVVPTSGKRLMTPTTIVFFSQFSKGIKVRFCQRLTRS